ncbi:MAG: hypothetical protein QW299_09180 [Candidatus Caldarchaeum sp.]
MKDVKVLVIANRIPVFWTCDDESGVANFPHSFTLSRGHPSDVLSDYFEDFSRDRNRAVIILGNGDYLGKWRVVLQGYDLSHVTWQEGEYSVTLQSTEEVTLLIAHFDSKGKPTQCYIGKPYIPTQYMSLKKHQEIVSDIYRQLEQKQRDLERKLEHVNNILRRAYENEPVPREIKVEEGEHRHIDVTDEDLLRWHINQARELKRKLKLDRDLVV